MRPNKAETAVYGCHDTYGDSHTTGLGRTCVPLAFKVFVCNLLRYRNRNGLHANLRPFSLRDFICNMFFFLVFVMHGLLNLRAREKCLEKKHEPCHSLMPN